MKPREMEMHVGILNSDRIINLQGNTSFLAQSGGEGCPWDWLGDPKAGDALPKGNPWSPGARIGQERFDLEADTGEGRGVWGSSVWLVLSGSFPPTCLPSCLMTPTPAPTSVHTMCQLHWPLPCHPSLCPTGPRPLPSSLPGALPPSVGPGPRRADVPTWNHLPAHSCLLYPLPGAVLCKEACLGVKS